jgi:hypothetical protein
MWEGAVATNCRPGPGYCYQSDCSIVLHVTEVQPMVANSQEVDGDPYLSLVSIWATYTTGQML